MMVSADTLDADTIAELVNLVQITAVAAPLEGLSPLLALSSLQIAFDDIDLNGTQVNQLAVSSADVLAQNWNTLSLLVAIDTFDETEIPPYVLLDVGLAEELNISITYTVLTNDYNATSCILGNWTSSTGNVTDLITIDDPDNCGEITALAYYPCTDDSECEGELVCTTNWAADYLSTSLPVSWCVPAAQPYPVVSLATNFTTTLNDTDATANLADVTALIQNIEADILSSGDCLALNFAATANSTAFQQNDVVFISLTAIDFPAGCQKGYSVAGLQGGIFTPIDQLCVEDLESVPGVLLPIVSALPDDVNTASQCGLVNAGFSSCNKTTDCADEYQCGALRVFDENDFLACQYDLQVELYEINITLVPTAANKQPNDAANNYAVLMAIMTQMELEIENSENCLSVDSVQRFYVPQVAPYLTASLFVTNLNMTNCPSPNSTEISEFAVTADSILDLYTVVVSTDVTTVSSSNCVTSDGEMIFASTCSATAAATGTEVASCTTTDDCEDKQTCVVVSSVVSVCLNTHNGAFTFGLSFVVMIIAVMFGMSIV